MLRRLFWAIVALTISVPFNIAVLLLLNLWKPFNETQAPPVPPSNLSVAPYPAPIVGQPPQPDLGAVTL